jgi:hypothetical protein
MGTAMLGTTVVTQIGIIVWNGLDGLARIISNTHPCRSVLSVKSVAHFRL